MSLIKCSECRKKFSDIAKSCPRCGCPISEVKKNINNLEKKGITKKVSRSTKNNASKKMIVFSIIVVLFVGIFVFLFLTVFNSNWKSTQNNFDDTYKIAKKKNEDLELLINKSEKLVYSKNNALDENLRPILETAISEAKAAKKDLPNKSIFTNKTKAAIKKILEINYDEEIENLENHYNNLEKSIRRYKLVDNPTESYVISCLKNVEHIKDIAAVTEENDPNGHLNKPGGYTATVYYSDDRIKLNKSIYGKTVIEQGTDGGGSIEVYSTVEDAIKRRDYLSAFDGGILSNGSHTVVGTVLIRTSDELTATQQKNMETAIMKELTRLEEEKEETLPEIEKEQETVTPVVPKPSVEKVTFYGGTTATVGWNGKGKLNTKTTFLSGEEFNFTGKISGFSGKKMISVLGTFPNGEPFDNTFEIRSGDVIGYGFIVDEVGNGSFTVKLTKTGEVLGHYEYTILPKE